jgi:hypothetical protein
MSRHKVSPNTVLYNISVEIFLSFLHSLQKISFSYKNLCADLACLDAYLGGPLGKQETEDKETTKE